MIVYYFNNWEQVDERLYVIPNEAAAQNQEKTNDAFSEKWQSYSNEDAAEQEKLFEFQKKLVLDSLWLQR